VGPITARRLRERGLVTVGRVARVPEAALVAMLGPAAGRHLHALAHNRDPRRVRTGHRRGSIGSQCALGRRRRSQSEVDAVLIGLVERVTGRLRKAGRLGRTVVLRVRFDDFTRATRSHTFPHATAETALILATTQGLLTSLAPVVRRRGLTLVGVAVANLENDPPRQLRLPLDAWAGGALDAAVDEIRARHGKDALRRAVLLHRPAGLEMPLLPD
jgi:DNA polymerase-4